jgi:hypothetical protein
MFDFGSSLAEAGKSNAELLKQINEQNLKKKRRENY